MDGLKAQRRNTLAVCFKLSEENHRDDGRDPACAGHHITLFWDLNTVCLKGEGIHNVSLVGCPATMKVISRLVMLSAWALLPRNTVSRLGPSLHLLERISVLTTYTGPRYKTQYFVSERPVSKWHDVFAHHNTTSRAMFLS